MGDEQEEAGDANADANADDNDDDDNASYHDDETVPTHGHNDMSTTYKDLSTSSDEDAEDV